MAESYSVRARLSATDSGFTSTFKRAQSAISSLGSQIKSGFAFGVLQGVGQAAFHAVTNSVSGLISEIDSSNASWKTFTKNMQMIGKSDKDIESVKSELQDFAQKTIYSSSDMATTFAQLEAVGVKNTTSLVKGFGGLAAAAENPQQAMKTLSQQATQMAAKPSVAWQDFKLMLEQTPAGIAAVAKEMGMTTSELVTKVQAGEIATDKFFDAIAKVGTNDAFTELATEAKTVGQAMDGLKETLGNKLTPAFEVLNKKGISIIDKLGDKIAGIDAGGLAKKVERFVGSIEKYFNAAKSAFSGVGSEIWSAVKEIGSALTGVTGQFGSVESVDGFKTAMQSVADVIKGVAGFCKEHAGAIAQLIKWLPAIVVGIKGFQIASSVAPALGAFTKGIAGLAAKGIGGIASKLFGISKSQKTVGDASMSSGAQMLGAAKSYALMGVAVLLIAAGFALLAFSAISLANAGGLAIGVMAGLVVALAGIGVGMALLLKTLAPMSGQLMPVATAMLAMGAAVVLVAAGFAIMAVASIALANAGGLAIGIMAGMVVAMALLAVGAAFLGTALTAGAVGFTAFGSAVLMVGAGFALIGVAAVLASAALTIVAAVLPQIAEYGLSGALAITALGASLTVFAVGAGLAGAACIVLGAGLLVVGAALLVAGAAMVVLGAGVIVVSAGLALLATQLPTIAAYGIQGGAAIAVLGAAMLAFAAGLLVANAALVLTGAAALASSVGVLAFGVGMTTAAASPLVLAAALPGGSSQMKTIAKNAKTAQSSLKSMQSSVKAVESGLNALGSKAKSAMKQLTNAFDDTASKAKSSGKKVGEGFTNGMRGGLAASPAVAVTITAAVNAALRAGQSGAFSAGAFISRGFANGMLSCLSTVQSAATRLAAAAQKAVEAKAKIASPSKVADKLGNWWGKGYEGGLLDMVRDVWAAAEKLVSVPTIATPDLAMAYSGELSADYEYSRRADYTIEVPLTLDGREVARATAVYTQDELDKRQMRNNRKHGKI